MKISVYHITILALMLSVGLSCSSSESSNDSAPTAAKEEKGSVKNLAHLIEQTKVVESGTPIPSDLCQQFIQPALTTQTLHPYIDTPDATYSYGQVLHEDSAMVAFTFYYKAIEDKNLLAASFIASYNPNTQEFIDSKMVFGSSTFNFQETKGYNLGFSCRSDMEFIQSDDLVLILKSKIKRFYSAFKKGVAPKANSINTHRYTLLKNGQFVFG